jgi:hypothetical protein
MALGKALPAPRPVAAACAVRPRARMFRVTIRAFRRANNGVSMRQRKPKMAEIGHSCSSEDHENEVKEQSY